MSDDRTTKVQEGVNYILENFCMQPYLFPRLIVTRKPKVVHNIDEIMKSFQDVSFIDCWINAFPYHHTHYSTYNNFNDTAPDFIAIDIDRATFSSVDSLNTGLSNSLKQIHLVFGEDYHPTILWTGNGYHIYIALKDAIPLEKISEFRRLVTNPSTEFLRFAEQFLSIGMSDRNHNASISTRNSLLRVPFTFNQKYIRYNIDCEIKIIHIPDKNGINCPSIKCLLPYFMTFLGKQRLKKLYYY